MGHSSHMPPVPPASRSDKGPGEEKAAPQDTTVKPEDGSVNTREQARFGNINQNTHHQGYQQDR
jgi:hypothetical protein